MNTLYKILLIVLVVTFFSQISFAQKETKNSVLVSQDFTEALAKSLTAGTNIEIIRAVPSSYSPGTHTSYMKKHWKTFSQYCEKATAVLTLTSSWPEDPLYPFARRANIRIVPVDASAPLDNTRAGVPLLEIPGDETQLPYVWNSPGNTARMADIAAADLSRLFQSEADTIAGNRDKLKQMLFKLRAKYEEALMELESFEVICLTSDFYYLTDEFGVSVARFFLKPEHRWDDTDIQQLVKTISETGVTCVLAKWSPKKQIQEEIKKAGAKIIVPKTFTLHDTPVASEQLISFYKTNLDLLVAGLTL